MTHKILIQWDDYSVVASINSFVIADIVYYGRPKGLIKGMLANKIADFITHAYNPDTVDQFPKS